MRAAIVTILILLGPVVIWLGMDYASGSHDRQVKQLWADEEALIRAKENERRLNPLRPAVPPAPLKPGERGA